MPTPADIRAQYVLQVRAEGQGELDRIKQEMERLRAEIGGHKEQFIQAATGAKEYLGAITPLNTQVNKLERQYNALVAAQQEQVQSQAQAISSVGAWASAVKEGSDAARAHNQQLADMARLQQHLGGMDSRTHEKEAAEAAAQAENDLLQVRNALGRMDARDAETARERVRLANEGTAAVLNEAEANKRVRQEEIDSALASEKAERARASAIEKATADIVAADAKVNAALAKTRTEESARIAKHDAEMAAEAAKHARFLEQEAEKEIAEAERVAAIHEQIRRADAAERARGGDAYTALSREQQHLNDVIAEGAQIEAQATTVMSTHLQGLHKLTAAEKEFLSSIIARSDAISKGGRFTDIVTNESIARLDQGRDASQKFGYAVLNVAHAIQDAQYGFGAVLNNIPLVVQAFGGGAGLAGTIMVAGVAFEVLKGHIGDVTSAVGLAIEPARKFIGTVEGLKKQLEALQAKPFKVAVDFEEIKQAEDRLKRLQERQAAFEATTGTKTQADIAAQAKEAIDAAGGSGKLSQLVLGQARGRGMNFGAQADIDWSKQLGEEIDRDQKGMEGKDRVAKALIGLHVRGLQSEKAKIDKRIQDANVEWAKGVVGDFALGREGAIKQVQGLVEGMPGAFTQEARGKLRGVPLNVEQAKARQDADKQEQFELREIQHNAEREQEKANLFAQEASRHAAAIGTNKALGGALDAEGRKIVAGGVKDPQEIKARLNAKAEEAIKGMNLVPPHLLLSVADKVLDKAIEKMIAELVAQDLDIQKAARAGIAAAEAKVEKPEIKRQAGLLGPRLKDDLDEAFLRKIAQGQQGPDIWRALTPQVKTRAGRADVPGDIIDDVTRKIIDDAEHRIAAELVGRFGKVTPQTATALMGERAAGWLGKARGAEKKQEAMQTEGLAENIFANSRPMTGRQFTPDQSRHAARKAVSMMEAGAGAIAATQEAMREELAAMGQLQMRLLGLQDQGRQLGNQARRNRQGQRPMPGKVIAPG